VSLGFGQLSAVKHHGSPVLGDHAINWQWLTSVWMVNDSLKSGHASITSRVMTFFATAKAALCLGSHSHLTVLEVRLVRGTRMWEWHNHMSRQQFTTPMKLRNCLRFLGLPIFMMAATLFFMGCSNEGDPVAPSFQFCSNEEGLHGVDLRSNSLESMENTF
jgi:hypothetical protein